MHSLRAAAPVFQDVPEKRNCAALLAFVSLLWCTEALPLYVTAMAVPLLAVVLRVMVDRSGDGAVRLSAKDAAPAVFKAMFSQARSRPTSPLPNPACQLCSCRRVWVSTRSLACQWWVFLVSYSVWTCVLAVEVGSDT